MKEHLFSSWGNAALSFALIAAALLIVVIALLPLHPLFKAFVLAYILLP